MSDPTKPPPKHTEHGNYRRADWFEARCAKLEAALRKYGRHTRNPCTATSDSKCVCGFVEALGLTSETGTEHG